jgi:hypothetical protein
VAYSLRHDNSQSAPKIGAHVADAPEGKSLPTGVERELFFTEFIPQAFVSPLVIVFSEDCPCAPFRIVHIRLAHFCELPGTPSSNNLNQAPYLQHSSNLRTRFAREFFFREQFGIRLRH